jgi:glycosyltransferase involved in cell wall biosynthesis
MKETIVKYSILVPVFNSAASLPELLNRLSSEMKLHGSFEIICVDDCSLDNSWEVLINIHKEARYPLKIYQLSRNYSQSAATLCAIDQSIGEHIITIDDDLQYDPKSISLLLETYHKKDKYMVFGVGKDLQHGFLYKMLLMLLGHFFRIWPLNYMNGENLASSFRVFSRKLLDIPNLWGGKLQAMHVANFNVDARFIAHVKVPHHERVRKNTSYSWTRRLQHFVDLMITINPRPMISVLPWAIPIILLWITFFAAREFDWFNETFSTVLLICLSSIILVIILFGVILNLLYQGKILAILNGTPPYLILEKHE